VGRNRQRRVAALTALSVSLGAQRALAAEGASLSLVPDPTQLLPLIALFALLVVPVNALIFRPIFRVLDAREEKSSGTRKRADRLEREATSTLESYERQVGEVRLEAESGRREKLESARAEGAEHLARARADAESELERARSEIASAARGARDRLRQQAEDLAGEAAARVLGRPLS
jgi:F-type H+-transporting ATPase subunit b